MLANLNGWHAVILLVIILLLFGAPKLPGLAKSLGQSMKIFKAEVKPSNDTPAGDDKSTGPATTDERTEGSQSQPKP